MTINKNNNHNYLSGKSKIIHRNNFFNYQRLIYIVIVSLFILIGVYNYRYVEQHCKYEYVDVIEKKFIKLNESDELIGPVYLYDRFKDRHEWLIQKCSEYKLNVKNNGTNNEPNAWEYLINDKYKLVWCNVFKAASSSWFYNFNLLAGYDRNYLDNTNETPVSVARKKYPRPSVKELLDALKDHLSFIIVRHPFERLVSAYRDKFASDSYNSFFRPLGKKIIQATRPNYKINKSYPPTFEEFVRYILCQWEFGGEINEHWTSIHKLCTPCLVDFDLILKVETLKEDQDYLINLANIQNIIGATWKNSSKNQTTETVTRKYFSQLTKVHFSRLIEMFKLDFELFGYSEKKYKTYAKKTNKNVPYKCERVRLYINK
ncbi:carbohydrate sulfotransferase 11-like [Microplitis mediator]|uniref:carbohydrate sulfotransferase 11-like n=1 Tax=Microplitis mediator TaxID=375433 RepID=UPI0025573BC4|nr:carbohydrate sulfotransferase 11-like [Microplitis mediator]